jgi:acetyl esterase/lipase
MDGHRLEEVRGRRPVSAPVTVWIACVMHGIFGLVFDVRADSTPDPFQFATREGVLPGTIQVTETYTVTGTNEPASIDVVGANYSVNGHAYTASAGEVIEGDVITVRALAPKSYAQEGISTLFVGGVGFDFVIRTQPAPTGLPTPSSFRFDDLYVSEVQGYEPTRYYFVKPRGTQRSAAVRVQNLKAPAPISIVGGSYRVNGSAYTQADGIVNNGDVVMVSAVAPAASNDAISATLKIGTRAASFTLYTMADAVRETPAALPGTQMFVVRDRKPVPLRTFVWYPAGWTPDDRRTAFVYDFGGAWTTGDASKSVSWAKWAASKGMVGIAPDYRTNQRFGTSPLAAVDDGRATLRWVQDHAAELGIDISRIVVGGNSAGGHVTLWSAIMQTPVGSDTASAPLQPPAAVVLVSAVSDTSLESGYTPWRFGVHADALNPQTHLDSPMPPTIAFHGDADPTVSVTQSSRLCELIQAGGGICQFVNVPGGDHGYRTQPNLPGDWKQTTYDMIEQFLREQGLLV